MGRQHQSVSGVSLDLFGTLVATDRPDAPADAVARALADRGVPVPDDWTAAFATPQIATADGVEVPLTDHVVAALASRSDTLDRAAVRPAVERAVRSAFEPDVQTREGAARTVETLSESLPVGVLSNCSVDGLAERALEQSSIDRPALDVVVTSVGCGWRKPDRRAFRAVADALGVEVGQLLHVGDDPVADGGAADAGARVLLTDETAVPEIPEVVTEWV